MRAVQKEHEKTRHWSGAPPAQDIARTVSTSIDTAPAVEPPSDQKLLVAVGAGDRAVGDAEDRPARLPGEPACDGVDDFLVKLRLAHDPTLAHPALADLELRLDQR